MRAIIVLLICLSTCFSCADEEAARKTVENQGFTDVEITGFQAFECGESDSSATGFRARNPQGRLVNGVVCCKRYFACLGGKGCTIRWNGE